MALMNDYFGLKEKLSLKHTVFCLLNGRIIYLNECHFRGWPTKDVSECLKYVGHDEYGFRVEEMSERETHNIVFRLNGAEANGTFSDEEKTREEEKF